MTTFALNKEDSAHFERVYTDEKFFAERAKHPMLAELTKAAAFPDVIQYRSANQAYLQSGLGLKPEAMNGTYETFRDTYAKTRFGMDLVTDEGFFKAVQGEFQTQQKRRTSQEQLSMSAMTGMFEAAMTGSNFDVIENFNTWKGAQEDGLFTPEQEPDILRAYKDFSTKFFKQNQAVMPAAAKVWDVLARQTGQKEGGTTPEDYAGLMQDLANTTPEQREAMYGLIAAYSQQVGLDKGVWKQIGEGLSRSVTETYGAMSRSNRDSLISRDLGLLQDFEQKVLLDKAGNIIDRSAMGWANQPFGSTRVVTDQERDTLIADRESQRNLLQIEREIANIATGVVDPLEATGKSIFGDFMGIGKMVEQGLYDGAQSAGYTAMAGVPVAGIFLVGGAIYSHNYDQLRLQYPEAEPEYLSGMAAISAAPEAAFERLQFKLLFGKLPMTGKLLERMGMRGAPFAVRFGAGVTANLFEQNAQEFMQDATREIVTEIGAAFNEDMPGRDFKEIVGEFADSRVETFFALLPMVLIGGGFLAHREIKRGDAYTKSKEILEMAGFSPEQRERLSNIEDPSERDAEIQKEWKNRTPEDILAGIAKAEKSAAIAMDEIQSVGGVQLEEEVNADGVATYTVKAPDGRTIMQTQDSDAALEAYGYARMQLQMQQQAERETAEKSDDEVVTISRDEAMREIVTGATRPAGDVRNLMKFQPVQEQNLDPAQAEAINAFRNAPQAQGTPEATARIVAPVEATEAGGMAASEFLKAFEALTGRKVIFYDTEGAPTKAAGVLDGRPDTIFVHTRADRNLFALVGHEWGHTVEKSQPELYRQLQRYVLSYTDSVKQRAGELKGDTYQKPKTLTVELTNNMIGDAFADPEFWRQMRERDQSLFEKILQAVQEWFDSLMERVGNSEWGTQSFTTQLQEMREGIIDAMLESRGAADARLDMAGGVGVSAAEMRATTPNINPSIGALGNNNPYIHPRTADGKYKGAPKWVNAPKTRRGRDEAYMRLRERLYQLVLEGDVGRLWYEDSGRAVLRMFNNDVVEAEKFIELLAIYSPQASVEVNVYFALRAYIQHASGVAKKDFTVKTETQDDKARSVLYDNQPWAGRKTDNFYKNIMYVLLKELPASEVEKLKLDPEIYEMLQKPVTVDMWVYRAFGFDSDALTDVAGTGAFGFAERELNLIAEELNASLPDGAAPYLPHQIQAMLWTSIKGRSETKEVKDLTEAQSMKAKDMVKVKNAQGKLVREFKDKEAQKRHMQRWITNALALPAEKLDVGMAAGAFDRFINSVSMRALWESVPSTKTPEGVAITNLPTAQKAAFTRASRDIILNENGNDMLAAMLGVPVNVSQLLSGGYGTGATPNVVTELFPNKPSGTYDDDVVRAYARAIQYIYRQDAVPWMRYIKYGAENDKSYYAESPKGAKRRFATQGEAEAYAAQKEGYVVKGDAENFAVRLDFGQQLTPDFLDQLQQGLIKTHDSLGFTQVSPTQVIVTNFRDSKTGIPALTDEEFSKRLEETYGQQADISELYTVGEYGPVHDWSADSEGGSILQASPRIGPDLLEWIRGRREVSDSLQKDWAEGRGVVPNNINAATMRVSPEQVARHADLEAKHDAGTITPEEVAEAQRLVDEVLIRAGHNSPELYHGTDADFSVFDPAMLGEATGSGDVGDGFYFGNTEDFARQFGRRIVRVRLKATRWADESVLKLSEVQDAIDDGMGFTSVQQVLAGLGYDGIIHNRGNGEIEYVVFDPTQIKSAEPFTGVPLDQRFDPESDNIDFSTMRGDPVLSRLAAHLRSPDKRLAMFQAAKDRWMKIAREQDAARAAISTTKTVDPTAALQEIEQQRAASLADLDIEEQIAIESAGEGITEQFAERIDTAKTEATKKALNREAKARLVERRRAVESTFSERRKAMEADFKAQADQVKTTAELDRQSQSALGKEKSKRQAMLQAIGELNAILSVFPAEIRGRVGGFTTAASISGTEKALDQFLSERIDMIGRELERVLKKEYDARLYKLFERAKPKREPGQKPKGKAGADIHSLFDTLKAATEWTAEEANAHIAALEEKLNNPEITVEQESHWMTEKGMVPLVADWKNADSERRAVAVRNAENVYARGYSDALVKEMAKRERRDKGRAKLVADTGKAGTKPQRDEKILKDNGLKGLLNNALLSLLNFEQVLKYAFGEKSAIAQKLADMEREASYQKIDIINDKITAMDNLFSSLAGGALAGEKLRWRMADKGKRAFGRIEDRVDDQPTIKAGDIRLSQMEGIAATMMWKQEDGQRHMIGKLDEEGNPISNWHYDQKFIDQVEAQLSSEARAVRYFLEEAYAAEYGPLNAVFRELNGIDLPQHKFYSPIVVKPMQQKTGQEIDPVTGFSGSAGSSTPGGLKTRSSAIAEPEFRDAVQTYLSHTMQMEHWKAYAPFVAEANALLGNRDVSNSITAKAGDQAGSVLAGWMSYAAAGGNREAAAHLAINQALSRALNRATSVALVGRAGVLFIQSTQLGAAAAEMPLGAYLKRISKLLTGNMGWGEALKSPYIQRRLKQMPPVVQQALAGLKAEKPNILKHNIHKLGWLIGGADALFTAGTYAMVYDYQLEQLRAAGMSEADAQLQAKFEAERITDRVAQPSRPGARSYFELTATNPMIRTAWSFASEARKNVGVLLWAMQKRPMEKKIGAFVYVMLINSIMAAILRAAWRDMRDPEDDEWFDEKNWNAGRLALMAATEPLYGIPLVGPAAEGAIFKALGVWQPAGGDLFSSVTSGAVRPIKNLPATLSGERDAREVLRDVESLLGAMGVFNSSFAAAASLSHIVRDAQGVVENTLPEE